MNVNEVMTANPVCCTPESSVVEAARMMVEHDCGCIPVVESTSSARPVGMITDRDITVRIVAEGRNPQEFKVNDAMTPSAITVTPDMDIEECCNIMEENQIRRVAVVDQKGACCGIVAQADIAMNAGKKMTGEVVQEVSKATGVGSQ